MSKTILYGPFAQAVTMDNLPLHGPLKDEEIPVIPQAGILVENGIVKTTGSYEELKNTHPGAEKKKNGNENITVIPAFVDCHTHICWAGDRTNDYAFRVAGKSYLEMARAGGGIMVTVEATRKAPQKELEETILKHADYLLSQGVAVIEVKSGYGLTVESELKMLRAVKEAAKKTSAGLIPTFLGAHIKPKDFAGTHEEYLDVLLREAVPVIQKEKLAERADIFVEKDAFDIEMSRSYIKKMQKLGFQVTVHADQFTPGSAKMAVEAGAVSADHLESTDEETIPMFSDSETVAVALPGASLGLGMQYPPCRKLLDNGACLAIATDWNPGSAPMGELLTQAAVMGAHEKLTVAETLAGITFRAAQALRLEAGRIKPGTKARFIGFPTADFRSVFYFQGRMKPLFSVIGEEYIEH